MSKLLPAIDWNPQEDEPMKGDPAHALNVKIEFATPDFFSANPKQLEVEENKGAGRVYILKNGRIVAVAYQSGGVLHDEEQGRRLHHRT